MYIVKTGVVGLCVPVYLFMCVSLTYLSLIEGFSQLPVLHMESFDILFLLTTRERDRTDENNTINDTADEP